MFDNKNNGDTAEQMLFNMINSQANKYQPSNLQGLENRMADIEAAFNYIWKEFIRGPGSYTKEVEETINFIQTNIAGLTILAEELLDILENKGIISSKEDVIEIVTKKLQESMVPEETPEAEKKNKPKKKDKKAVTKKKTSSTKRV